jgi:glutathione S-transferase
MQLFHAPASPFVRKVMVVLHETGLIAGTEVIAVSGTPVAPGSLPLDRNPIGKIPVLVTPDGTLYDSRVICRYLDHLAGGAAYPAPPALWATLTLEAMADGLMDAAVLIVYEGRVRPEERRHAPWVAAQWARIARALDALEAQWMDHLTAARTGCPDMGQIAVAVALDYLDFRHADRDWRAGHDRLAAWQAAFAQRPSMRATVPA